MTLVLVNEGETARSLLAGLEQAVIAVVMIDADNNVIHFNAAAERLWGYDRSEILGRNVDCLVPEAIRQHHDGFIANNRATAVNRIVGSSREVRIERKDGSEVWGSLSMSRVEVDGVVTYMGFMRDVTEEVNRREQIALLGMVVDRTNRAIYVTGADTRICYVNDAFVEMFGFSMEESIGLAPEELLIGAYTSHVALDHLYQQIRAEGEAEEELLVYDKDGNEIWISIALNAIHDDDGKLKFLVALMTDITESKQLQSLQQHILEALAAEQPLAEVMDNLCRKVEAIAPDVICSLACIDAQGMIRPLGGPSLPKGHVRDLDGVAIGPNSSTHACAVYNGETVLVPDIAADENWARHRAIIRAAGLKACWITPIKAKDGHVIGTFTFYYRECRGPSRWHQNIVDACVHLGALALEREEARQEISRLAYFDTLTGLPNRAYMRQLMEQSVAECTVGKHVAVMFLDLDHFKDVNDTLGHAVGDQLLVTVANRLRQSVRPGDIISRQGGDEFIVVMPNSSSEDASSVAARITESLSAPLQLGSHQVAVSVSAGISMYPDNADDLDNLLKYADAAMYKAKQAGRSTYRFFCNDMDRVGEARLGFHAALRNAIAQNALQLHYQPQIRTADDSLYGVEALARWHDPVLGNVSPAKFIPLAEECGLIEQIGMWSVREACRQMAAWRDAGLDVPCVSVNLSPINFQNAELPRIVAQALAENGLRPDMLMLEITEGIVMNEHATAIDTMRALRDSGVGLSMDDFGTGYSSLSRLAQLPVRELKIDRSFMRGIESEVCALAVATAVVRVGQSLNMMVVAEGVETEGQRKILTELGCDVIQGFLYSPALSPFDFEAWLAARNGERWSSFVADRRAAGLRDRAEIHEAMAVGNQR